jgi:hypothetical protein
MSLVIWIRWLMYSDVNKYWPISPHTKILLTRDFSTNETSLTQAPNLPAYYHTAYMAQNTGYAHAAS